MENEEYFECPVPLQGWGAAGGRSSACSVLTPAAAAGGAPCQLPRRNQQRPARPRPHQTSGRSASSTQRKTLEKTQQIVFLHCIFVLFLKPEHFNCARILISFSSRIKEYFGVPGKLLISKASASSGWIPMKGKHQDRTSGWGEIVNILLGLVIFLEWQLHQQQFEIVQIFQSITFKAEGG